MKNLAGRLDHWLTPKRARRAASALLLAALITLLLAWCAPSAHAIGIPGLCDPEAPMVDLPDEGFTGIFVEKPLNTIPSYGYETVDPEHLFAQGGLGGMTPFTYDLGCGTNPGNWIDMADANTDTDVAEMFTSIGQSTTALADSVDRRAWQPGWIITFLSEFAEGVTDIAVKRVVIVLVALGLLATTAWLAYKARKGNVALVLSGVAWVGLVLVIGAFLVTGTVRLAVGAQAVGGEMVTVLHGSEDPALGATETVTYSVHYQAWLRRVFGDSESATAKEYGPKLLANTRMSWEEFDRTDVSKANNDAERENMLNERKQLIEDKQKRFNDLAAEIKDRDPQAYEHLQNRRPEVGVAFVEAAFAGVASGFRLAVDLLLILCMILLTFYAIVWIIAIPWIVTPAGESMGRGLLNVTSQSAGYVIVAAIGSWLFGIYAEAALMPGLSAWWSLVLLVLGTLIFWTVIRPDRKALSLVTMGRAKGSGKLTKWLIQTAFTAAIAGATGGAAGAAAAGATSGPKHGQGDNQAPEVTVTGVHNDPMAGRAQGAPMPPADPIGPPPPGTPAIGSGSVERAQPTGPHHRTEGFFDPREGRHTTSPQYGPAYGGSPLPDPPPAGAASDEGLYHPGDSAIGEDGTVAPDAIYRPGDEQPGPWTDEEYRWGNHEGGATMTEPPHVQAMRDAGMCAEPNATGGHCMNRRGSCPHHPGS